VRVVVALGGNALLRRDQPVTVEDQRATVARACDHLAALAGDHELVVSHGNGPQIGLLAADDAAHGAGARPLDVLGAETQGMLGYLIEQALVNRLPVEHPVATVLTMVEVDPADPAWAHPTKPIGPLLDPDEAADLARRQGWSFHPEGGRLRRVVASPAPHRIVEERQIRTLLDAGCVVVCAGGGGVPTIRDDAGLLRGVEAVVDKDLASALLARHLLADLFVMATDVAAVHLGHGTPAERSIVAAHPGAIVPEHLAELGEGSMRPKVVAACDFARATGRPAVIGALDDIEGLVAGTAGTRISTDTVGLVLDDGDTGVGDGVARR
jgi:carbamate kinase